METAQARDQERNQTRRWIAVGALLSVLMRLRMFWSPVSVDEGGYLAIARAWAHGDVLYRDVWVDRPQGLLVLFRVWDWLSGGSTASIRIMAMLFGVLLVVSTATIVRELVGSAAARWTAIVCGVVSSSPVLEAHAANGELLSGAVSAAGLALAVLALSKQRPLRWFFASGVLAGLALSLKQSGFDGLLAIAMWLLACAVFLPHSRRASVRYLGALIAGLCCVLAALMIHGALTGWSRWWTAVAGYRLRYGSAFAAANWGNLAQTSRFALAVLGTTAVVAIAPAVLIVRGVRARRTMHLPRRAVVLVVWAGLSVVAFLVGGGFWRHYWLLIAAPTSALAGVGLSRVGRYKPIVLAALLAPCLAVSVWVFAGDTGSINVRAAGDRRSIVDQQVAKWFISHRQVGDNMYVLCASAAAYADAHQDPGYPYLWRTEVLHAPNSQRLLVEYLADSKRAPRFIAQYQSSSACDVSGRVRRILCVGYHRVALVDHIPILERNYSRANLAHPCKNTIRPFALAG